MSARSASHGPIAPLFVPGDRPERFVKAANSGADAIIIDLEDAVAPAHKEQARRAAAAHDIHAVPVFIRINATGTPWFDDDLAMLARANITGVMVPKAAGSAVVGQVRQTGVRQIIPLVESANGIGTLDILLRCEGVVCAAFGALDLALDLGCAPDWEPLLMARSELVLRSRIAGIAPPIDAITPDLDDLDVTSKDAKRARMLGFGGKLAIHPKQINPIHRAFQPSPEERAWAEAILAGLASEPQGAFRVGGAFVDEPVLARARRILGGERS